MNEQKGVESIVASSRNSLLAKRCLWLSTTFAQRCEDSLQAQLDTHNCFKNLRMTLNDRFQNTTREINSMVLYNFWICFARIAQHRLNNRSFLIIVDEDRYWRSSLCLMRLAHRKAELSFEKIVLNEWMLIIIGSLSSCAAPRKPWKFRRENLDQFSTLMFLDWSFHKQNKTVVIDLSCQKFLSMIPEIEVLLAWFPFTKIKSRMTDDARVHWQIGFRVMTNRSMNRRPRSRWTTGVRTNHKFVSAPDSAWKWRKRNEAKEKKSIWTVCI